MPSEGHAPHGEDEEVGREVVGRDQGRCGEPEEDGLPRPPPAQEAVKGRRAGEVPRGEGGGRGWTRRRTGRRTGRRGRRGSPRPWASATRGPRPSGRAPQRRRGRTWGRTGKRSPSRRRRGRVPPCPVYAP